MEPLPVVAPVQLQGAAVRENDKLCAASGEMRRDGVRVLDPLAPYLPVHGEDFAGTQRASSAGDLGRVGVELCVDDVTPVAPQRQDGEINRVGAANLFQPVKIERVAANEDAQTARLEHQRHGV